MAIPAQNIKAIFIGAVVAMLWGGYNISKASYYSINWNETEGTVVDFERHVMTCGKGVGECYSLLVGYHVDNDYFVTNSSKKFNRTEPVQLLDQKVVVYYAPDNHSEAILGGKYGPFRYGVIIFLVGIVILSLFWLFRTKQ